MDRFTVSPIDPIQYKDQILKLWEEYLPGTPPARLEWMKTGNPAGPAIWFCAFDNKTNEIAGMISVTPREFILKDKAVRAGILGDFIVGSNYRVFGPNLILPKTVLSNMQKLGFKFIYTIPNAESEKIAQRIGFKKVGHLYSLIKPLDMGYYIRKYVKAGILLSPFFKTAMRVLSRDSYVSGSGVYEEVTVFDLSFSNLWGRLRQSRPEMVGDHGPAYLKWKYIGNPLRKVRILTYRKDKSGDLLGFLAFAIYEDKLHIFDIIAAETHAAFKLLKKIITIGNDEKCLSVNLEILESNPMFSLVKSCRFFDAKSTNTLYSFGDFEWPLQNCIFFAGDRNI